MRVRCAIVPSDMLHISTNCRTAEKMALTLLDYLFHREVQAVSNLSGQGKHGKKQLDPLTIYGIRCKSGREGSGASACATRGPREGGDRQVGCFWYEQGLSQHLRELPGVGPESWELELEHSGLDVCLARDQLRFEPQPPIGSP